MSRVLSDAPEAVSKRKWRKRNPKAARAATAKWRQNNKAKVRSGKLRNKYGIDQATYDEMLLVQGGRCAICDIPAPAVKRGLHVDHNHQTGKVRALLCGACNTSLGLMKEEPELLRTAAEYLEHFGE